MRAGHGVAAVFTQPDRPKGRSQTLSAPPVKEAALRLGIPVHQPEKIRTAEAVEFLRSFAPEVMVVVGYGKIIPQSVIDIPPHGVINVHASLLPEYRGAAPIQWAIANGESRTGVTTMRIDAGLDTGDILLQRETGIDPEETALELGPKLARIGAGLLVETLARIADGTLAPRKQDNSRATMAPILTKEDGRIDWNWTASKIHNRIRGFLPWPGCHTSFRGRQLQIWRARPSDSRTEAVPGALAAVKARLLAACGEGTWLELVELQPEGRKRMEAAAFLSGYRVAPGEVLGVV